LVLRVIMLNNNIRILLVSFVHHIELQNFLSAPRNLKFETYNIRLDSVKYCWRELMLNVYILDSSMWILLQFIEECNLELMPDK